MAPTTQAPPPADKSPTALGLSVLLHQMRRTGRRALQTAAAATPLLFGTGWGAVDLAFALVIGTGIAAQFGFQGRHVAGYLDRYPARIPRGARFLRETSLAAVVGVGIPLGMAVGARDGRLFAILALLGAGACRLAATFVARDFPPTPGPRPTFEEATSSVPRGMPAERAAVSPTPAGRPTLAIACSGGGVRAAAFCLGSLQRLLETGWYARADRVYAVSGGSYIAAGIHVARRASVDATGNVPSDLFLPDSPEAEWLRRKSSFLISTRDARMRGVFAVLYGLLVNLFMVALAVWLLAQWLAWTFGRVGAFAPGGSDTWTAVTVDWLPSAAVTWAAVGLLSASLVVLVGLKSVSKYTRGRSPSMSLPVMFLSLSLAAAVASMALPAMLVGAHNAATQNKPSVTLARAVTGLGLVSEAACDRALVEDFDAQAREARARVADPKTATTIPFHYGACGQEFTDDAVVFGGSVALPGGSSTMLCRALPERPPAACTRSATWGSGLQWGSLLATVLALAGLVKGLIGQRESTANSALGRLWVTLRDRVLPWLASVVVVLGVLLALLLTLLHHLDGSAATSAWPALASVAAPLVGFGLVRILTDATISSLHPFYRDRIGDTFFVRRADGIVAPATDSADLAIDRPVEPEGPALTVLGVANASDVDYVPAQRGCLSFRFETANPTQTPAASPPVRRPAYLGLVGRWLPRLDGWSLPAQHYAAVADPEGRETTLAAACAASGAAFSPIVGRESHKVAPYRLLLTLANARLGIWLPNPYYARLSPAQPGSAWKVGRMRAIRTPGPFRILKEAFGRQSLYDSRLYITDGGHFDNTGMVEALRDGPRCLVVMDASADAADSLDALTDAMTTAQMDLGLVVRPARRQAPGQLRTDGASRPALPYLHLEAVRQSDPEDVVCDILFVKNVLPRTATMELEGYAGSHPEFPRTTTINQFYGEYDWEAYRQLGYYNTSVMESACRRLMARALAA